MDIMTGVGLVAGIIVIATMMLLGGDLHLFVSEHAIIIIFGGSIAATMIRFPLGVMLHGLPLGAKFAFTMSRLTAHDLVDELWLKIFPVTIGTGKRLFEEGTLPASYILVETQSSPSGVMIATYKRAGELKTGSVV